MCANIQDYPINIRLPAFHPHYMRYLVPCVYIALFFQPILSNPALANTNSQQPKLIASIEAKVQEFINQGNALLIRGNPENTAQVDAIYTMSKEDWQIEQNLIAISFFDKALRLSPSNRDALYGRGVAYLQIHILSEYARMVRIPSSPLDTAISNLSQVTQMDSSANFAPVYLQLGQALLLNNSYEDSIQANLLALKKGTRQPAKAHKNIGLAYSELMLRDPGGVGPEYFNKAEQAWLQAAKLAPNDWQPYQYLAKMHQYAHEEFGYPQASLQKANAYSQKAVALYQQSPQGQAERAAEREQYEREQAEQAREQQQLSRQEAWANRPCTPINGSPLTRHMCLEGYLNPNTVQGADQPMPANWQP